MASDHAILESTQPARERSAHRTASRRRRGLSLVELIVAITVLIVALGAVSSTLIATRNLNRFNRELGIAAEAAQSMFETLRSEDFFEVFARFNADDKDDPGGKGTAPGNKFVVENLSPRADDADGIVGEISFPAINKKELREDFVDAGLGMPRDLNLDGAIDALDHALDYRILPIRIRLEWTGVSGDQEVELLLVLGEQ
jgi:type II secretory pathway pseudopilin PulG